MDASVRTSPRSGVRLERFKSKYLKPQTLTSVLWVIVRAIILLGLCYIILYPFFIKIINAFKTYSDFLQNKTDAVGTLIQQNVAESGISSRQVRRISIQICTFFSSL